MTTDKDKQIASQLQAEMDAKRKQKTRARLSKFLGKRAERNAHDSIPKSKRRWNTKTSRWEDERAAENLDYCCKLLGI